MQNPMWLATGGVFVLIGALLMRWAGRYDATGHALTLADPSEKEGLQDIEHAFGLKLV